MILSYCLNVHPGEALDEVLAMLAGPVARVRAAWRPDRPMGVGLWLAGAAAREVAGDDAAAARLRDALAAGGLFAYTVNAFPMGDFHAARVKRDVYRPDWLDDARLDYTLAACRALDRILPAGARGSVSTVPVSYAAFGHGPRPEAAARNLGRLALELERIADASGRDLAVALEPEPLATLETTAGAVAFLEEAVFGGPARDVLTAAGLPAERAEAALRRRIGLCVDTCHLACQFEDLGASLERIAAAGIRVPKAQLSSALELVDPAGDDAGRRRLRAFDEPRYLHQSIGLRPDGARVTAEDLPDLLDPDGALAPGFADVARLRTHFHVPLAWAGDGALGTTRPDLEVALPALARATDHLEVETYTFSVLPADDRARFGGDPVQMITAELRWAEAALAAASGERPA